MSCLLSFCTYGSFLSAVLIPESTEEAVWAAQVWSEQTQYYPCRFPPRSLSILTATNTDFVSKGFAGWERAALFAHFMLPVL